MLSEYKKIYEDSAQALGDWKKINKNDLCRLYIENEDNETLKNAYLSAIILNYWNKIGTLYKDTEFSATPEDCYGWVVDGILYALKKRKWTDETNKLFNDKNAPDKVINRKIKHIRSNFLKAQNRDKRKINLGTASLEELHEDYGFDMESQFDTEKESNDYISVYIKNAFNKKDYFTAFIVDGIINYNCYDFENGAHIFNVKRLARQLGNLDEYVDIFANNYDLNIDEVKLAASYVTRISSGKRKEKINNTLSVLRHVFKREDLMDDM